MLVSLNFVVSLHKYRVILINVLNIELGLELVACSNVLYRELNSRLVKNIRHSVPMLGSSRRTCRAVGATHTGAAQYLARFSVYRVYPPFQIASNEG